VKPHRETQRDRVFALLNANANKWVALPEILQLGIAQFGARILELRGQGFDIENKIERDDRGVVHSWYRLVVQPTQLQLIAMPTDLRKSA
jgi:hypothetical protein